MTMISDDQLFTVFELYLQNGRQFGFYITNSMPRSYVQVNDFGHFVGTGDLQEWHSVSPEKYSIDEARRKNLTYLVDRYEFGTNRCIGKGLHISESIAGWSRYQPDL